MFTFTSYLYTYIISITSSKNSLLRVSREQRETRSSDEEYIHIYYYVLYVRRKLFVISEVRRKLVLISEVRRKLVLISEVRRNVFVISEVRRKLFVISEVRRKLFLISEGESYF